MRTEAGPAATCPGPSAIGELAMLSPDEPRAGRTVESLLRLLRRVYIPFSIS